ncbi:glycoside hydrolase family 16 protein, partial [Lentithecium fluviatile CBS 122367]
MFCIKSLIFLLLFLLPFQSFADVRSGAKNCSCGFYDAQSNEFFTDSIIVYFNETSSVPTDFVVEDYEKKYEKDWNAVYRQGADSANVQINESSSLQMTVSPADGIHLVNGAGIRTARRDIQHGSFRTLMKSPRRGLGGSAMSVMWQYNDTETAEISVMNTNDPTNAWVGTFVGGEFTTRSLGVNFSTILNASFASRNFTILGGETSANGSANPWEYVEYRIDWTKDFIKFYIDGNLTRTFLHRDNQGMPSVPSPFFFKHWSTGNRFTMEGPPSEASVASIGWVRMFFNSSSMTEKSREEFTAHCSLTDTCSLVDATLRGSTLYTDAATVKWKQSGHGSIKRMPALWISLICIAFSACLLVHAFLRRAPWWKQPKAIGHGSKSTPPSVTTETSSLDNPQAQNPFNRRSYELVSGSALTLTKVTSPSSSSHGDDSKDDLTIEKADPTPVTSVWGGSTHGGPSRPSSFRFESQGTTPQALPPHAGNSYLARDQSLPSFKSQSTLVTNSRSMSRNQSEKTIAVLPTPGPGDKVEMETVTESALPAPRMRPQPPPPRERVDYLAGLVALCAILVTVMHFGLTFVPGMIVPGAPKHHESELWAQRFISPFILNQMWLGVFFTTSVRFLVASYLKRGNLHDIAKAAVRRTPRLMIPVASIALLQYFLIDVGATKYLRYIPSITWSTWPYVTRYPTFGHYVSEILELVYLIPNAVPQITYNYCTGVLWTIAVQLQGSWLVLCGVIVVYEIKSPWKRMCYYIFCLTSHWYAQSWGSYLWLGLLLTDLDITYAYKKWLHERPGVYFPLISICWLCVTAAFSANMIPNWLDFSFTTYEHNIHPDPDTGEPLWNTPRAGYPEYFIPRLNGLLFAGGMQAIVELSPAVQWLLSRPFLLVLFPHIFTIYLMHGVVFWSWGSWLMVSIAERGFGFGINVTVVGITSYVVLFAILPVVTPVVEALGKDVTALVWMGATEKSPPRRRTLFPFPEDLLGRRG